MVLNAIGRGVAGRLRSLPWLCHVLVRRVTRSVLHGTNHRGALCLAALLLCLSVRCEFGGFLALVPCV